MKFLQVQIGIKTILVKGLTLLVTASIVLGCSEHPKRDIRDYYFPLKSLMDGLVYEYQAIYPDSLAPYYWFYRAVKNDQQVFLTGTNYEVDLIPKQFIQEELVDNGMLINELTLYHTDSTNKQVPYEVNIEAPSTFPFYVSIPGGIFLYRVNWQEPTDSMTTTTLIKNRRYLGDTTFLYKDKSYDCIAFEVKELVAVENEGVLEQEFEGVEFYAKGIGLVYVKKQIAPELSFEYALADRYPMDTLEQKFLQLYPN